MKKILSVILAAIVIFSAATTAYATSDNDTHTHDFSVDEIIYPTCTENGAVFYSCSCGEDYIETIYSVGHEECSCEAEAANEISEAASTPFDVIVNTFIRLISTVTVNIISAVLTA